MLSKTEWRKEKDQEKKESGESHIAPPHSRAGGCPHLASERIHYEHTPSFVKERSN